MLSAIARLDTALRTAVRWVSGGLLLTVTVLAVVQVFARYVLNDSIVWGEELIRLLYVWLVLVAATAAPHMRIGILADAAPGLLGTALATLRVVVMAALLVLIVRGALTLNASFGADRYVTLGITKSWYWSGAIACGILWIVLLVTGLLSHHKDEELVP
ncbi:TRAP transporter small permease subunit [Acuticoccus sp. M5D2P5]|uniref:TRAP transporter small permease n=1 Tax=Acuticoccus kalidii TaxID=2910977 RepID=UPI001F2E8287|nr:TRAP transporter small permease subunit [Acuticoccus kalidii]MCF3934600.1 TRAP transporter small permease subunit [Acuticoccus kalidii]